MACKIVYGECVSKMKEMDDNSIDFVVTDPPYGFKFMNKKWDYQVPSVDCWKEVLRIVKPGAWIAVFGGTRTYHRLVVNVEDAGFEIRDCINWIYGSGFPKSHNNFGFGGYGTALKPAHELILLAMKPLDGTFAQNAEKWGVGGINIDASRIFTIFEDLKELNQENKRPVEGTSILNVSKKREFTKSNGRWPANIIFDEESTKILDQMTGILKSGGGDKHNKKPSSFNVSTDWEKYKGTSIGGDSGGASRFFYCAKASLSEKNKGLNKPCSHPTVKPISLMKYIITLLAPPENPILLDPFMGSGTTLIAAKELGISAIGIEKELEYVEIAEKRTAAVKEPELELF
jgi:site-specific DNA-methyltransferase (adenine-specific)